MDLFSYTAESVFLINLLSFILTNSHFLSWSRSISNISVLLSCCCSLSSSPYVFSRLTLFFSTRRLQLYFFFTLFRFSSPFFLLLWLPSFCPASLICRLTCFLCFVFSWLASRFLRPASQFVFIMLPFRFRCMDRMTPAQDELYLRTRIRL